jgi:hypothetical protein
VYGQLCSHLGELLPIVLRLQPGRSTAAVLGSLERLAIYLRSAESTETYTSSLQAKLGLCQNHNKKITGAKAAPVQESKAACCLS